MGNDRGKETFENVVRTFLTFTYRLQFEDNFKNIMTRQENQNITLTPESLLAKCGANIYDNYNDVSDLMRSIGFQANNPESYVRKCLQRMIICAFIIVHHMTP